MLRCAFLTLDESTGFVIDDELAYPPLTALGWRVEAISWRTPSRDWRAYDAVVIRSTWDYIADPDAFLAILAEIERAGTPLFNALDLVRWNIRKTYLRELAERGVPVVPTIWYERLAPGQLPALIEEVGADEVVIKPVVGLNAHGVFRVNARRARQPFAELTAHYAERGFMAQPFLSRVITEGEFSLIYFNGRIGHTILKTPKAHDFRVQEEHGGVIRSVHAEPELREAGDTVLRVLDSVPLYARADFVRANDGRGFWLMELELIEPSLYLRMDPDAPDRFAQAFHERASGAASASGKSSALRSLGSAAPDNPREAARPVSD
jgi:glutathione synthase/RimK-type ligase-like ATP-grasp enzyme